MIEEIRNDNLARMDLFIMHFRGNEVIQDHTGSLLRVVVGLSGGRENPRITVHHRKQGLGYGLAGVSQDGARAKRGRLVQWDSGMACHFWIAPESRATRKIRISRAWPHQPEVRFREVTTWSRSISDE